DLRLLGVLGEDPLVLGQNGVDPGRGGAAIGQLLDDPREQAEPALQPAKPPRLQNAQNTGRVVLGDGFGWELPRRGGGRRPFAEARDQRSGTLQEGTLVLRQGAVVARERL